MGLGTNRDYKTRHRNVKISLAVHNRRMNELIAEGISRDDASKQAYGEFMNGKLSQYIKEAKKAERIQS